ncbi:MAG: non-canonical purine NTP pyrophosphatase [Caldilineaceae bacterium]|nr:non-canonical purine NTP pyrophosphatase [Caldilineaceae bacterium]
MIQLLFATGNRHKFEQVRDALGFPLQQVRLELPEVQAIKVQAVIEQKARAAYSLVNQPVLVEDTGLSIHAWNGLPGALVAWFLDSVGVDGICKMLAEYDDLSATAETFLGFYDGERCAVFSGRMDGRVVRSPRGSLGFGWDPVFSPDGWDKTFAEMTPAEKETVSMRSRAVEQLRTYLQSLRNPQV